MMVAVALTMTFPLFLMLIVWVRMVGNIMVAVAKGVYMS